MKSFKILEKDAQFLWGLLLEFPAKHQGIIEKCIEILKGLEEIKEEIKKED
jgi:hypothetical protein